MGHPSQCHCTMCYWKMVGLVGHPSQCHCTVTLKRMMCYCKRPLWSKPFLNTSIFPRCIESRCTEKNQARSLMTSTHPSVRWSILVIPTFRDLQCLCQVRVEPWSIECVRDKVRDKDSDQARTHVPTPRRFLTDLSNPSAQRLFLSLIVLVKKKKLCNEKAIAVLARRRSEILERCKLLSFHWFC